MWCRKVIDYAIIRCKSKVCLDQRYWRKDAPVSALNSFRVTCRSRRVIQHVDVVSSNKFRLKLDIRCVATSFSYLIESTNLELEFFGCSLPQWYGLFIVIEHHYVSDKRGEALLAHIENLLKISGCAENCLKSCLFKDVIDRFLAHRVIKPNDSSLISHRGKFSRVPLPSILGPDGNKGPLFSIFINPFDRIT